MRKINISSDQRYFNVLLHEMTNVPEEVSAERLRKVMALLQKKSEHISPHNASNAAAAALEEVSAERMRNGIQAQAAPLQKKSVQISLHNARASNAAAAGKRACSAPTLPTAAIGHGHGEDEDEQPGGVDCGAGAAAPAACVSTLLEATRLKCEAFRTFGLDWIRQQGADTGRLVSCKSLCQAYAVSLGVKEQSVDWIFRMKYLDFASLRRAAVSDDVSMWHVPDWRGQSPLRLN